MNCCICGDSITGYGNNPYGALDKNEKVIIWKDNDRCCNKCNFVSVIPGRIRLMELDDLKWRREHGKGN